MIGTLSESPTAFVATRRIAWLWAILAAAYPTPTFASECIRQSFVNHDYCGPEASKIKYLVPDRIFASFKGSCATHDFCYAEGGERIIEIIEEKYQISLQRGITNYINSSEFYTDTIAIVNDCNETFKNDMLHQCREAKLTFRQEGVCVSAAFTYSGAVWALGKRHFERATRAAFACRFDRG